MRPEDGKGPTHFERIEKIELGERPRSRLKGDVEAPVYRPVARASRAKWPWVVIVLALGAVAALRLPRVRALVNSVDLLPARAPRPMVVMSNPNGATLIVDGKVVGQTPWAGDNHWQGGGVPYELSKDGYVTLKGRFEGGKELTLELELKHK